MIQFLLASVLFTAPAAALAEEPKPAEFLVDDDARQRYLLHGLAKDAQAPAQGWRLLVVFPGGDGSAEFAPFVGSIRANALGDDWLVAQIVAPVWDEEQAEQLVWPTQRNPWPGMEFTCEELFEAVVDDVARKCKLDQRYLFTLAWSSGGMLAYTLGLEKDTRVTGTFIAMSVYKPDQLPSLRSAKGRGFWLFHSPEDRVCPLHMAEQAHGELEEAGAAVELATYAGGHGWHGDIFGEIRRGVSFLEKQAAKGKSRKPKK
jgi:predicted esterase